MKIPDKKILNSPVKWIVFIYLLIVIPLGLLRNFLGKAGIEFRTWLLFLYDFILVVGLFIVVSAYIIDKEKTKPQGIDIARLVILYIFLLLAMPVLVFCLYFVDYEREEKFEDKYVRVFTLSNDPDGFPEGVYAKIGSFFRKKITMSYKFEELLENRYGVKFNIEKGESGYSIIPEDYPFLSLKLMYSQTFKINFEEALIIWYFENYCKENDISVNYEYLTTTGDTLDKIDELCFVIYSTDDFASDAYEISEFIKVLNNDPLFQKKSGIIKFKYLKVNSDNSYTTKYGNLPLGNTDDGGKGDYFENPENILKEFELTESLCEEKIAEENENNPEETSTSYAENTLQRNIEFIPAGIGVTDYCRDRLIQFDYNISLSDKFDSFDNFDQKSYETWEDAKEVIPFDIPMLDLECGKKIIVGKLDKWNIEALYDISDNEKMTVKYDIFESNTWDYTTGYNGEIIEKNTYVNANGYTFYFVKVYLDDNVFVYYTIAFEYYMVQIQFKNASYEEQISILDQFDFCKEFK